MAQSSNAFNFVIHDANGKCDIAIIAVHFEGTCGARGTSSAIGIGSRMSLATSRRQINHSQPSVSTALHAVRCEPNAYSWNRCI